MRNNEFRDETKTSENSNFATYQTARAVRTDFRRVPVIPFPATHPKIEHSDTKGTALDTSMQCKTTDRQID